MVSQKGIEYSSGQTYNSYYDNSNREFFLLGLTINKTIVMADTPHIAVPHARSTESFSFTLKILAK